MGPTILVVDDDADIRDALSSLLEELGYLTLCAANGKEALERLRRPGTVTPRLILLDLMMPVMDGFQFIREQRKDAALASIPVVVVTAGSENAVPGALEVLKKPVRAERLLASVEKHCLPATS
jgi:two-component system, chemotaxis family, chemotaxis protein CheY